MFYKQFSIFEENNNPIFLIAHGFLGSSNDLFCSKLIEVLSSNKLNYLAFDFTGHGNTIGKFSNLHQMFEQYSEIFFDLSKKYPANEIIPIGFSQGGAIVLKFLAKHHEIRNAILFAPLSIPEMLISDRLNIAELELLKSESQLTKDFGNDRIRNLDKTWLESYQSFLKIEDLWKIKTNLQIFFAEDDKVIHKAQNQFLTSNLINYTEYLIPKANHTFSEVENWDFIKKYFTNNDQSIELQYNIKKPR